MQINRIMKRITRLTESDLHRIVKESVKKVLNEGTYQVDTLPDILSNMASYAEQCINNGEDVSGYYSEIIETGLFHDSEGKTVDYDSNSGMLRTSDDY